jgi:hypothetical protein
MVQPADFTFSLQSSLSDDELQQVTAVIDRIGLGDCLRKNPFTSLRFAPDVIVDSRLVGGFYDYKTGDCEVSTVKDIDEYGQELQWGKIYKMSAIAQTPLLAIQRTFVHEIGHHLHSQLRKVSLPRFHQTMLSPQQHGPSRYAKVNPREYFAESFSAYVFARSAMVVYDEFGWKMMERVLQDLGIEVTEQ